jgi:membrane-associated protein
MSAPASARRHPSRRPALAVVLAGVAGLLTVAVLTGVVELPSVGDALEGLSGSLGAWAYLLVPGLAFLETGAFVGLLVPGETAVMVGGVVAERGDVALLGLIALVWMAAVAGDLVSFLIGRRFGRPFLERYGPRLGIGEAQLSSAERFFTRFGGRAVVFGRFVSVLRALTPFIAGASGFPLRSFVAYSVAGTLAWATTYTLIGYLFAESFAAAGTTLTTVLLALVVVGAAASLLVVRSRRRAPELP